MRIVIIGGSGHVGTYLVPRLVEAGHEVINISRKQRQPYQPHAAWQWVQPVILIAPPKKPPAASEPGSPRSNPTW